MTIFEDNSFSKPHPDAIAPRHALMLIRKHSTGRWHIAFVPAGARYGDISQIHIFEEYQFRERDDALAALKDAHQEILSKAEKLRSAVKRVDKKS
jgi:hypothetical protein